MVKGTSRQVIVMNGSEEKLFEQAIFILRDNAREVSDEALLREARGYLTQPGKGRRNFSGGVLWGAAGAVLGMLASLLI